VGFSLSTTGAAESGMPFDGHTLGAVPGRRVSTVSAPPASILPGRRFGVTDTTRNEGLVPAPVTVNRYHLSTTPAWSTAALALTGNGSVPTLGPGVESARSIQVTVPAATPPRTYYLLARAHATNKLTEMSKANNCLVAPSRLTVGP